MRFPFIELNLAAISLPCFTAWRQCFKEYSINIHCFACVLIFDFFNENEVFPIEVGCPNASDFSTMALLVPRHKQQF